MSNNSSMDDTTSTAHERSRAEEPNSPVCDDVPPTEHDEKEDSEGAQTEREEEQEPEQQEEKKEIILPALNKAARDSIRHLVEEIDDPDSSAFFYRGTTKFQGCRGESCFNYLVRILFEITCLLFYMGEAVSNIVVAGYLLQAGEKGWFGGVFVSTIMTTIAYSFFGAAHDMCGSTNPIATFFLWLPFGQFIPVVYFIGKDASRWKRSASSYLPVGERYQQQRSSNTVVFVAEELQTVGSMARKASRAYNDVNNRSKAHEPLLLQAVLESGPQLIVQLLAFSILCDGRLQSLEDSPVGGLSYALLCSICISLFNLALKTNYLAHTFNTSIWMLMWRASLIFADAFSFLFVASFLLTPSGGGGEGEVVEFTFHFAGTGTWGTSYHVAIWFIVFLAKSCIIFLACFAYLMKVFYETCEDDDDEGIPPWMTVILVSFLFATFFIPWLLCMEAMKLCWILYFMVLWLDRSYVLQTTSRTDLLAQYSFLHNSRKATSCCSISSFFCCCSGRAIPWMPRKRDDDDHSHNNNNEPISVASSGACDEKGIIREEEGQEEEEDSYTSRSLLLLNHLAPNVTENSNRNGYSSTYFSERVNTVLHAHGVVGMKSSQSNEFVVRCCTKRDADFPKTTKWGANFKTFSVGIITWKLLIASVNLTGKGPCKKFLIGLGITLYAILQLFSLAFPLLSIIRHFQNDNAITDFTELQLAFLGCYLLAILIFFLLLPVAWRWLEFILPRVGVSGVDNALPDAIVQLHTPPYMNALTSSIPTRLVPHELKEYCGGFLTSEDVVLSSLSIKQTRALAEGQD